MHSFHPCNRAEGCISTGRLVRSVAFYLLALFARSIQPVLFRLRAHTNLERWLWMASKKEEFKWLLLLAHLVFFLRVYVRHNALLSHIKTSKNGYIHVHVHLSIFFIVFRLPPVCFLLTLCVIFFLFVSMAGRERESSIFSIIYLRIYPHSNQIWSVTFRCSYICVCFLPFFFKFQSKSLTVCILYRIFQTTVKMTARHENPNEPNSVEWQRTSIEMDAELSNWVRI